MEILRQLGELFLESVPTIVIVLLFYFFLRWSFFGPIQKAMAERAAKIEGARAEAAAAQAEAEKDVDAYNEALRKARVEIFSQQETARGVVLEERARLLKAMRARVQEEVAAAKQRIAVDLAAARKDVEAQTPVLAGEIVRGILERQSPLRGGRAQ
ncbi:MAG TPA: ATP synthase F0 subunit B [Candidatus Acidoferrales bacterium]|nr:ATP synthase F0 subunit B [Candidatus Acidoferrales bacterium]